MGLWPTRSNENQASSPRKRGPIVSPMDSRLRGNDVIFGGAAGDEECRTAESTQSEILRFAQDDSEGLRMTPLRRCHTGFLGNT